MNRLCLQLIALILFSSFLGLNTRRQTVRVFVIRICSNKLFHYTEFIAYSVGDSSQRGLFLSELAELTSRVIPSNK